MTEPAPSLQVALTTELGLLLAPLADLAEPEELRTLIRELGFALPAAADFPQLFADLATAAQGMVTALVELAEANEEQRIERLGTALTSVRTLLDLAESVGTRAHDALTSFPDFLAHSGLAEELPRRLLDRLIVRYLREAQPMVYSLALLTGLVEWRNLPEDPAAHRLAIILATVRWERLGQLFTAPGDLAEDVLGWRTGFKVDPFIGAVGLLFDRLGFDVGEHPQTPAIQAALGRPPGAHELLIPLYAEGAAEAGLRLSEVPANGSRLAGIGLFPYVIGTLDEDAATADGLAVEVRATGLLDGGVALLIRPPGDIEVTADLIGGTSAAAEARVRVRWSAVGRPIHLFGAATGSNATAKGFAASLVARSALRDGKLSGEAAVEAEIVDLRIVLALGDADSFLSKILPAEGLSATVTAGLGLSTRTGIYLIGSGSFEVTLPVHVSLAGVVTIEHIHLGLRVAGGKLALDISASATAALGPIAASVERVGFTGTAALPTGSGLGRAELAFKPPKGVGLAISAGPVSGGGYLFLDPDKGEYAGVLELSVNIVSLKAIGLLTTRLPDGRPGFSLLLIITAEFPPIQLGFGFALLGVGGLLGVNRTVALDPLREGVRTRALDAVLFPKNPVANATQLLGALRTLFPPAEGRYTFGPMLKIGWGPGPLLEIELALILELPMPLRLIVAGRMRVRLPDEDAPVVVLRLDVVGILDMDRGEVSIDASLVDSRIAAFTISGDMAMRVGWKGNTQFALAVGGFHPRFTPPPGFPALRRLAISLGDGDNPRIRLEAYLAITSNTVQFGARLDLYVEAGPFNATAYAGLDALVQFSPFHFVVTLSLGIDVSWGRTPILHAQLEANLEGPSPWHVYGFLEFAILFIKARIDVDLTIGEAVAEPPPRVNLVSVLRPAVEADDAWAVQPPPASASGVTLRAAGTGAAERLVMSPFGQFTVRQRALPLATTITRYGAAVPEPGTPDRFEVRAISVGGDRLVAPPAVYDGFAAAQYADLTDDERLSRPAFERMPSGVTAGLANHRWPRNRVGAPIACRADIHYDEAIVDDPDAPTPPPAPVPLNAALAGLLVAGGASALSPTRQAQAIRGPDQRVRIVGEQYVAAPRDTLPNTPQATPAAYAQATDHRGSGQIVTAGEVTG
ncbi:DUF6603 domain-containing protein [Streptomyces sp. NBC_01538]|uniref:DUF6603 domain-containing protein n=1 Tax=Streptomyces sp. NBC_01538 TaxID=2903897 RepID=UPI003864742F